MSLVHEIFGDEILKMNKNQVIALIRSSPLIVEHRKDEALRDWAAAVGVELSAEDFATLHKGE